MGDLGSIPGLEKSPGGGPDNPLQRSGLENSHGWRSLASYSPWGHKESDMTERLSSGCHTDKLRTQISLCKSAVPMEWTSPTPPLGHHTALSHLPLCLTLRGLDLHRALSDATLTSHTREHFTVCKALFAAICSYSLPTVLQS